MVLQTQEELKIISESDIVQVRATVKRLIAGVGFSAVNQTKIVTAASELARNTLDYGLGGSVKIEIVENGGRLGVRLRFEDKGPGIADVQLALKDGYTTGGGMGLGLSGSKRLMDDFAIQTQLGEGTTVMVTKWK